MVSVNVDKTIENLLTTYAAYIKVLLAREDRRIERKRYKNADERQAAKDAHTEKVNAQKFLEEKVAADPKKYLYYPYNIIYTGIDKDGNVGKQLGALYTEDSVDRKFEPIYAMENEFCMKHVITLLSKEISDHVRSLTGEDSEGTWAYYGPYTYDWNAENILELNKYVHMLGHNDFVRFFQQFVPAKHFAAPLYPKHTR